jgi:hypothetical protein
MIRPKSRISLERLNELKVNREDKKMRLSIGRSTGSMKLIE